MLTSFIRSIGFATLALLAVQGCSNGSPSASNPGIVVEPCRGMSEVLHLPMQTGGIDIYRSSFVATSASIIEVKVLKAFQSNIIELGHGVSDLDAGDEHSINGDVYFSIMFQSNDSAQPINCSILTERFSKSIFINDIKELHSQKVTPSVSEPIKASSALGEETVIWCFRWGPKDVIDAQKTVNDIINESNNLSSLTRDAILKSTSEDENVVAIFVTIEAR